MATKRRRSDRRRWRPSPTLTRSSLGQIVEVSVSPVLRERHDAGTVGQKLMVGGTAPVHVFGVNNFIARGVHRHMSFGSYRSQRQYLHHCQHVSSRTWATSPPKRLSSSPTWSTRDRAKPITTTYVGSALYAVTERGGGYRRPDTSGPPCRVRLGSMSDRHGGACRPGELGGCGWCR